MAGTYVHSTAHTSMKLHFICLFKSIPKCVKEFILYLTVSFGKAVSLGTITVIDIQMCVSVWTDQEIVLILYEIAIK